MALKTSRGRCHWPLLAGVMLGASGAAVGCGLDGTFGNSGRVRLEEPGRVSAQAHLVEDGAGRLLVATAGAGPPVSPPATVFLVARLLADGRLDATFGAGGRTTYPPAQSSALTGVWDAAVDSQDRLVIGGNLAPSANSIGFVMRFGADGFPDPAFGGGSPVTLDVGPGDEFIVAIAIDSQDRVVFASSPTGAARLVVGRLTTSGTLDGSFDGDGMREIDLSTDATGLSPSVRGVALDQQQRIVLGGGDADQAYAVRLLASGADDMTFAGDGRMVFSIVVPGESVEGTVWAFTVDDGNRVLFGGEVVRGDSTRAVMAARVDATGIPDLSFGGDGFVSHDLDVVPGGGERALGVLPRATGVTLAGAVQSAPGGFGTGGQHDFLLLNLDASGAVSSAPCPVNPAQIPWRLVEQANDRAYSVVRRGGGFVLAGITAEFGPEESALGDVALAAVDPDAIFADGFDR